MNACSVIIALIIIPIISKHCSAKLGIAIWIESIYLVDYYI